MQIFPTYSSARASIEREIQSNTENMNDVSNTALNTNLLSYFGFTCEIGFFQKLINGAQKRVIDVDKGTVSTFFSRFKMGSLIIQTVLTICLHS